MSNISNTEEIMRKLEEFAEGNTVDGKQVISIKNASELLNVEDVKKLIEQKYDQTKRTHKVDVLEPTAETILSGIQPFFVAMNTSGFQRGDFVKFRVQTTSGVNVAYHALTKKVFEVTYVHCGVGMKDNFVCVGINETESFEK